MSVPALQNKVWIGLVAVAVIGGSGIAAFLNHSKQLPGSPVVTSPSPSSSALVQERQVAVYWIEAQGKRFVAVPVSVKAPSSEAALKSALTAMLQEPVKEPKFYSAIPAGTKLLDFSVKGKDIRLNLSKEFKSGGGSAGVNGRVVQVLYTATSLDPDANVFLSVEGKPVQYLGGEGLEIPQPVHRKEFPLEF